MNVKLVIGRTTPLEITLVDEHDQPVPFTGDADLRVRYDATGTDPPEVISRTVAFVAGVGTTTVDVGSGTDEVERAPGTYLAEVSDPDGNVSERFYVDFVESL